MSGQFKVWDINDAAGPLLDAIPVFGNSPKKPAFAITKAGRLMTLRWDEDEIGEVYDVPRLCKVVASLKDGKSSGQLSFRRAFEGLTGVRFAEYMVGFRWDVIRVNRKDNTWEVTEVSNK